MSWRLSFAWSSSPEWRNPGIHECALACAAALALAVTAHAAAAVADSVAAQDGVPGHETLRRAFANRYDLDVTQRIQLIVSNGRGEQRSRVVEMASKRIDGRLHSLGRFTHPPHLRGTTLLVIENRDRSDDQFVLLPGNERIRRVAQARRGDAFMGTDFTYEDLERHYAEDFEVVGSTPTELGGEPVVVIRTRPRGESAYHLTEFSVSPTDFAILRVRYFDHGGDHPIKILDAPREAMREVDGHVLPTLVTMQDLRRRTQTEATFEEILVNPELDDSLFTGVALESGRRIPIGRQPQNAGAAPR